MIRILTTSYLKITTETQTFSQPVPPVWFGQESVQSLSASRAVLRLQAARLVVKTRVDDAAVVAGLMDR